MSKKNILVVLAHPKENSLNGSVACLIQKTVEIGNDVEVLNLYKELKQNYLVFDRSIENNVPYFQEKIDKATDIILCFPVWYFDAPAILKNFWDVNFTKDFAYSIDEDGKQHGMLSGKNVYIVSTAGAKNINLLYKFVFFIVWGLGRIGFAGMKYRGAMILGDAVKGTKRSKEMFFEKIERKFKQILKE